jgi:8-oxo-dGTP pyrophosphatase MutT (NUDIX family)
MAFDKAFLFLIHRNHGLLLLYKHKKSKGYYYEVPGGNVDKEDFVAACKIDG